MRVVALERGFFGGNPVEVGEEFEVPEGRKAHWYAPVNTAPKAAKPPRKDEPKALSAMGKEPAKSFVDAHEAKGDLA